MNYIFKINTPTLDGITELQFAELTKSNLSTAFVESEKNEFIVVKIIMNEKTKKDFFDIFKNEIKDNRIWTAEITVDNHLNDYEYNLIGD